MECDAVLFPEFQKLQKDGFNLTHFKHQESHPNNTASHPRRH